MTWRDNRRDLKIDSQYGDFSITNNDLVCTRNNLDNLKDVVIERYKTNAKDFLLVPTYGANLERFIGKGIDQSLINNIVTNLKYSLTYDKFVNLNELEIIPIILNDKLRLFTYITIGDNKLAVESIYDYKEGVFKIA